MELIADDFEEKLYVERNRETDTEENPKICF